MRLWQTNPFQKITFTYGEGCHVWDGAGKSYLDLLSGTWCNVLGYAHPRWTEGVRDQITKLTHIGAPFLSSEIETGMQKLTEILPPTLNRLVFLNTGSEAVELALKLARATTGADGTVVVERGYYGATTFALKLSEIGRMSPYLPGQENIYRLPVPNCSSCPMGYKEFCAGAFPCLNPLKELTEKKDHTIAAVMYEPLMAGAGNLVPPPGYGARVRELTTACHALLISEEVTTGIGRTGKWFGFEHDGIVPDILVIGKAIGAGLPVAAVVTTEEVETRCNGALGRHVQSHQNDPFSGRMAAEVIAILQDEKLVTQAEERGNYFIKGLKKLQASNEWIKEVRGRGLMLGIELHPNWASHGPAIAQRLLDAGFIVDFHVTTSTFRLFPPYIITHKEIDSFLHAFNQALGNEDNMG